MSDREAILFANEAFYQAFRDRDMDAMEDLWSEREDVTCIHPGWPLLLNRKDVLQSWMSILANPESPAVQSDNAVVRQAGDMAYVTCYERIDDNVLVATNVFVRDGRRWRMMHHQAGPTSAAPAPEQNRAPSVN